MLPVDKTCPSVMHVDETIPTVLQGDETIPSVLQGDETLPEADHEDAEQVQGEVPHVHQEADEKFGEQAEQPQN